METKLAACFDQSQWNYLEWKMYYRSKDTSEEQACVAGPTRDHVLHHAPQMYSDICSKMYYPSKDVLSVQRCTIGSKMHYRFKNALSVQRCTIGPKMYYRIKDALSVQRCTIGSKMHYRFKDVLSVQRCTIGSKMYYRFKYVLSVQRCTMGRIKILAEFDSAFWWYRSSFVTDSTHIQMPGTVVGQRWGTRPAAHGQAWQAGGAAWDRGRSALRNSPSCTWPGLAGRRSLWWGVIGRGDAKKEASASSYRISWSNWMKPQDLRTGSGVIFRKYFIITHSLIKISEYHAGCIVSAIRVQPSEVDVSKHASIITRKKFRTLNIDITANKMIKI